MKPIRFIRSARRHRIGKAHAVALVERPDVFLVIHVMPNY